MSTKRIACSVNPVHFSRDNRPGTDAERLRPTPENWFFPGQELSENEIRADRNKLVTIVVPCHNEAEGIEALYGAIRTVINAVEDLTFEVICVDDGSSDQTLPLLLELIKRDARFHVIELSRRFGKEAALTAGLDAAQGDAIIPIDADLQDPPELIPVLLDEWRKGAEVVLARRTDRGSDSFMKRKTAELFYRIHNRMSSITIPQGVGDFRLMDRIAVDALKTLPERQRFMKGLFAWLGFKTVTIDYTRHPRAAGTSKFSGWKLWNFALEGFTSFSAAPLTMWTYLGGIGALVTMAYAGFVVVRVALYGIDVPGYASLLVAMLFFGSLQLISVGLLGEYIGRIYLETKHRPRYLVRRKYRRNTPSAAADRSELIVPSEQTSQVEVGLGA